MRFLSDLPFIGVGFVVAVFLLKLFVSLRVASEAPAWQELGDQEPRDPNSNQAAAGIRTEQISLDADALPGATIPPADKPVINNHL
jgi:hypothetical protein